MINLMYLVLTALLALNVSAEVMNAFFSLDKGMKSSTAIVQKNNEQLMAGINKQADAYKKPENEKYRSNAQQALQVSDEFITFIEDIRKDLFAKAGGPNPKVEGQPKDIRNKDLTTRIFVNEGLGDKIQQRLEETRKKLIELADNDKPTADALPLDIEKLPADTKAKKLV